MRILVCGGRNFSNKDILYAVLDHFKNNVSCIIHGGARGADQLAGNWANLREIPVQVFYADWNKYGKSAGPIRNQQMLDEGKPDLVIAFPGGTGTADMMTRAKDAKIALIQV